MFRRSTCEVAGTISGVGLIQVILNYGQISGSHSGNVVRGQECSNVLQNVDYGIRSLRGIQGPGLPPSIWRWQASNVSLSHIVTSSEVKERNFAMGARKAQRRCFLFWAGLP